MTDPNNDDVVQFPYEITISSRGGGISSEIAARNDIPVNKETIGLLYHYPGEVLIHGTLDRNGFEPERLEYEGVTYTPEAD